MKPRLPANPTPEYIGKRLTQITVEIVDARLAMEEGDEEHQRTAEARYVAAMHQRRVWLKMRDEIEGRPWWPPA